MPDGMGLELDEFNEWKALWLVRAEEAKAQGDELDDDEGRDRSPEKSNKEVVTDDAAIRRWFATS